MTIGGIDVETLAARFGTPLLAFDLDVLDASLERFLIAGRAHGVGVSYAAKAFLTTAFAKYIEPLPIGLDVASVGELVTCERAGIAAPRITLHGAGKTDEELHAALSGNVGRIAVDSVDELKRLATMADGRAANVLLRINTGIEAHTHEMVRTAGDNSKFGLAPQDEAACFSILRDTPSLTLVGVHAHVGSQVYDGAPFVANTHELVNALKRAREAGFATAATIVVGGGFGVPMNPDAREDTLDIDGAFSAIRAAAGNFAVEAEPGRAIVASAGTSIYRVMAIKRFSQRTFVIVDGSMADNPRPALYGAYHHVSAVRQSDAPRLHMTVSGRSCENDELATAMLPSDIRAGDLLTVEATGAYTYSMASNYNRFFRPAVVAVKDGDASSWARRETIDDLLRADS